MSNGMIAFLLALGIGAWIYNFFIRRTGNQMKPTLIISGVVAGLVFIIVLVVLGMIS